MPYYFSEAIWPWIARVEMGNNLKKFGECFQALCLYLVKIIKKLVMVCTSHENSLDTLLLVYHEHFEHQ